MCFGGFFILKILKILQKRVDNFSEPLVDWVVGMGVNIPRSTLDTIAVILITLILSYFTLVFGELVPKRIAMKKSEELALIQMKRKIK